MWRGHQKPLLQKPTTVFGPSGAEIRWSLIENVRNKIGDIQLHCVISWLHMVAETSWPVWNEVEAWSELYKICMYLYLKTFYTSMEHYEIKKEKDFMYNKIQLLIFIAYFSVKNISQLYITRLEICVLNPKLQIAQKFAAVFDFRMWYRKLK